MSHPYKSQADSSKKSKMSSVGAKGGKLPNLDMNGAYKDVKGSTGNIQQHKDQNAAPGMKRGGRLDKGKRSSKPKNPIARDMVQAPPPSPEDMIALQAGAGGNSPPPAPAPALPPSPMMRASGGRVNKYPLKKGGADSGVGRLEQAKSAKH